MSEQRHFRLIVVGDNHSELIKKYNIHEKVKKYLVYKFSDKKSLHEKQLKYMKSALDAIDKTNPMYDILLDQYESYNEMDDLEFYTDITEGFIINDETGDAYSEDNPDGKYDHIQLGGQFALPLITKEGKEVYSCRKGDVDWSKVHLTNSWAYEFAWDSVMEGKKPVTDDEKTIYNNMKNRKAYFEHYGDRDNYVRSNTAFWAFAFLSEKTGWKELEHNINQYEWVNNFYDNFIIPLGDDELITVYECRRESGV